MVLELLDSGESVVVLDNLSTGFRWAVPANATLVVGDVGDQDLVRSIVRKHGVDSIIHFAGSIVVPEFVADPLGYYHNNTVKSRALMEVAVELGIKRFIFSSTAAVYGMPKENPVREDAELKPMSPYGSSKLMTEIMLADTAARARLQLRGAALFQRRRRRPQGPLRPVDAECHAPHQGRLRDGARQAPVHGGVRHRLPDARRHLHPRLHPRDGPGARAPRGAALPARRRRVGRVQLRLLQRLLGAAGDRGGEARVRRRLRGAALGRAVRATRRRSSRPPTRSACGSAGGRNTTTSTPSRRRLSPGKPSSASSSTRANGFIHIPAVPRLAQITIGS